MTDVKITESFDYHAEAAKVNFQNNISSLIEIQGLLIEKLHKANESQKDSVWFSVGEVLIIKDWLNRSVTELMAEYTLIDRTNRLVNLNYEVVKGLLQRKTPSLKSLIA